MTIYYHSLVHIVKDHDLGSIQGVLGYESRALAVGTKGDTVILSKKLKEYASCVMEHYDKCGLSYCSNVVFSDTPDVLREWTSDEISVFLHTRELLPYTKDEKRLQAVEYFANKNNFVKWVREQGLFTPGTLVFANKEEFFGSSVVINYPVLFKKAISDSGVAIHRCSDEWELVNVINRYGNKPFQLQEVLPEGTRWLNVQFYGDTSNGKIMCSPVEVTEQVLNGYEHSGNRTVDINEYSDIWPKLMPMATHMVEKGLKGVFGLDIAVPPGKDEYYLIECNPRWNGASYPTRIADAKKLNAPRWCARYYYVTKTKPDIFINALDRARLTYNPESRRGVVVFNWGSILDGKAGIMIISNNQEEEARIVKALNTVINSL